MASPSPKIGHIIYSPRLSGIIIYIEPKEIKTFKMSLARQVRKLIEGKCKIKSKWWIWLISSSSNDPVYSSDQSPGTLPEITAVNYRF